MNVVFRLRLILASLLILAIFLSTRWVSEPLVGLLLQKQEQQIEKDLLLQKDFLELIVQQHKDRLIFKIQESLAAQKSNRGQPQHPVFVIGRVLSGQWEILWSSQPNALHPAALAEITKSFSEKKDKEKIHFIRLPLLSSTVQFAMIMPIRMNVTGQNLLHSSFSPQFLAADRHYAMQILPAHFLQQYFNSFKGFDYENYIINEDQVSLSHTDQKYIGSDLKNYSLPQDQFLSKKATIESAQLTLVTSAPKPTLWGMLSKSISWWQGLAFIFIGVALFIFFSWLTERLLRTTLLENQFLKESLARWQGVDTEFVESQREKRIYAEIEKKFMTQLKTTVLHLIETLRAPLSHILGKTLILKKESLSSNGLRDLDFIESSLREMRLSIDQISEAFDLKKRPLAHVSLDSFFNSLLNSQKEICRSKNIEILYPEISPDLTLYWPEAEMRIAFESFFEVLYRLSESSQNQEKYLMVSSSHPGPFFEIQFKMSQLENLEKNINQLMGFSNLQRPGLGFIKTLVQKTNGEWTLKVDANELIVRMRWVVTKTARPYQQPTSKRSQEFTA